MTQPGSEPAPEPSSEGILRQAELSGEAYDFERRNSSPHKGGARPIATNREHVPVTGPVAMVTKS